MGSAETDARLRSRVRLFLARPLSPRIKILALAAGHETGDVQDGAGQGMKTLVPLLLLSVSINAQAVHISEKLQGLVHCTLNIRIVATYTVTHVALLYHHFK